VGARSPFGATRARFVALLLLVSFLSCSKDDGATGLTSKLLEDTPISVSLVDPDTATVDTTVTVRITGAGFPEGSTATWTIDTTEAPGIRTLSTTWKSAEELEARIAISPEAELRSYSIRIRGKKGKQGIAVERFRVVAKPVPLPEPGTRSVALDVNDSGVIVGSSNDASGAALAVRWTPLDSGWTYTILGPGAAVAINNGGLVLRRSYDILTRDWSSSVHLPSGSEVALGLVFVNDISNNGTIIGWMYDAEFRRIPYAWKQVSAVMWGSPQSLPTHRDTQLHRLTSSIALAMSLAGFPRPQRAWAWFGDTAMASGKLQNPWNSSFLQESLRSTMPARSRVGCCPAAWARRPAAPVRSSGRHLGHRGKSCRPCTTRGALFTA
jgi:hypothetical protein